MLFCGGIRSFLMTQYFPLIQKNMSSKNISKDKSNLLSFYSRLASSYFFVNLNLHNLCLLQYN